ncbi:hypothetical protein SISSUDRAFT_347392 [Sistotremastrum suecicum HHB10207 ss-3]|uniref:Uncharacterized protein n=1 Tax=Sistotremastrum suecicum HHB10207 ss-3 TaxID=1314776 RepID=A0A166G1A4_9AGAM|nr:hypothetical protein SISSUDRAFT_347392 [Sistotremastrum suecicum HHB10207 ss-3]
MMRLSSVLMIFSACLPQLAMACEGPCIVGVTENLVSNFTAPVDAVFNSLEMSELLPNHDTQAALNILQPVQKLYVNNSYDNMERNIFPGFFHGKCQVNGVDPKGCPNPDCPVVCGTPGSIIHFYSTFIQIAFNTTENSIIDLVSPSNSSSQYKKIESAVLKASSSQSKMSRFGTLLPLSLLSRQASQSTIKARLPTILGQTNVQDKLSKQCGGAALPNCNWISVGMKQYVLSWP